MYDTLFRMYKNGQLTQVGLNNAVAKGWITPAQRDAIIAGQPDPVKFPPPAPEPTPEPTPEPSEPEPTTEPTTGTASA